MRNSPGILTILLLLFLCCPYDIKAQDDVVYRLELGGAVGVGFSLNDVNAKFYGNSNLAAGLIARFPLNPRMAIKTSFSFNNLKGSTDGVTDFYPANPDLPGEERLRYEMSGGIYDFCALYELHFLPYGWEKGYQGYSRITPYIQAGLGLAYGTPGKAFTATFPIGVGLKWKVKNRLNLGLDWRFHFTANDKLDGLEAPHGIKSSEFRNKDHFCQTLVTLTYDLSPKCPTCNKDNKY